MNNVSNESKEIRLRDYLGKNFENFFSDKGQINHLFNELEIKQEFKNVETKYQVDDFRTTTVINTINKVTGNRNKIVIDLILIEPTWQQMMDVTFDIGADCDKKIVIYNGAGYPGYDINSSTMAVGFAKNINYYKENTYIVGARAVESKNGKKEIIYDVKEKPGEIIKDRDDEVPTKEEFHHLEYAIYHDETLGWEDPPLLLKPGQWFGNRSSEPGPVNFDFSSFWEDDGFYVGIITGLISDIEMMTKIKDKGIDVIKNKYKGCKIVFLEESGVLYGITVRVWDWPISDFANLEHEEKNKIIHRGNDEHGKFSTLIQEMIEWLESDETIDFSEFKI